MALVSPLLLIPLMKGYAGGDEAKMLQRHLLGTSAKVGIGANRAAVASYFLEKYGCLDFNSSKCFNQKAVKQLESGKIGAVILDDGMQVVLLFFSFICCWDLAAYERFCLYQYNL